MKTLKRILNLWLPVIVWASTIFYLSSIPSLKTAPDPFWDEIIRNGAHLFFYGVGYWLFFRALNHQRQQPRFFWPLLLVTLYGLSDELHQSLVPTRTFQLQDLLFDFSGAFIAYLTKRTIIGGKKNE